MAKTPNKPKASESDPAEIFRDLQEIPTCYARSLNETREAAQKQWSEAYGTLAAGAQAIHEEALKNLEDIQHKLNAAVQEAASKSDPQHHYEQAYRNYLDGLKRATEEVQKRYNTLYHDYNEICLKLNQRTQKQAIEAYREYLRSTQEAWSKLDVNAMVEPYLKLAAGA